MLCRSFVEFITVLTPLLSHRCPTQQRYINARARNTMARWKDNATMLAFPLILAYLMKLENQKRGFYSTLPLPASIPPAVPEGPPDLVPVLPPPAPPAPAPVAPPPAPAPTPTPAPAPTPTPEPAPKPDFEAAYARELTYPDWWPGTPAPNSIQHVPQITDLLDQANSLNVLDLYKDRLPGGKGPILLVKIDTNYADADLKEKAANNMAAAKQTLANFKQLKATVWNDIYAADRALINLIINWLDDIIKRTEIVQAARAQNDKAREAYEKAKAEADPAIQTNYLVSLQRTLGQGFVMAVLQQTQMVHIRESGTNNRILSTRAWGYEAGKKGVNIKENAGIVHQIDLLQLPINPREVETVNRKLLEAGIGEGNREYKITFVGNKGTLELDLGPPISIIDVPGDRPNSEIDDIGRNIRYSAGVVWTPN